MGWSCLTLHFTSYGSSVYRDGSLGTVTASRFLVGVQIDVSFQSINKKAEPGMLSCASCAFSASSSTHNHTRNKLICARSFFQERRTTAVYQRVLVMIRHWRTKNVGLHTVKLSSPTHTRSVYEKWRERDETEKWERLAVDGTAKTVWLFAVHGWAHGPSHHCSGGQIAHVWGRSESSYFHSIRHCCKTSSQHINSTNL